MRIWKAAGKNSTKTKNWFLAGLYTVCYSLLFLGLSANARPFGGLIAKGNIKFLGSRTFNADSFDSSTNVHSVWQTNLFYHGMNYGIWSSSLGYDSNSPPSKTANATIGTDGTSISNSFETIKVCGYLDVAPGGTASLSSNCAVGDLNWIQGGSTGIQGGHIRTDMNLFLFKDVVLPTPTNGADHNWLSVPVPPGGSTNIGGVTYARWITNGPANSNLVYYSMNQL